jgi:hypothetical protein
MAAPGSHNILSIQKLCFLVEGSSGLSVIAAAVAVASPQIFGKN